MNPKPFRYAPVAYSIAALAFLHPDISGALMLGIAWMLVNQVESVASRLKEAVTR